MSNYLLDSNHASPLVTLYHPLRQQVLNRIIQGHSFAISVPVLTETVFGLSLLPRAIQNLDEWDRLRKVLPCLVPDERDAQQAAELMTSLRKRGRQLETIDALIATVALRHDLILLTTDRDFEAVPSLLRENWVT